MQMKVCIHHHEHECAIINVYVLYITFDVHPHLIMQNSDRIFIHKWKLRSCTIISMLASNVQLQSGDNTALQ